MVNIWLLYGYYMVNNELVGGIPTPLKNDGVRQLGKSYSQYFRKKYVPNHPTRHNLFMPTRCTKIYNFHPHPSGPSSTCGRAPGVSGKRSCCPFFLLLIPWLLTVIATTQY